MIVVLVVFATRHTLHKVSVDGTDATKHIADALLGINRNPSTASGPALDEKLCNHGSILAEECASMINKQNVVGLH
jgi:hypothetical protein